MSERKYLPTLADLVDRLSIVQLKSVFIPEHKQEYADEMSLIMHDIGMLGVDAKTIHAAMVVMLANRVIWENESKARHGGSDQDHLLKFTHSVNGIRNTAKNVIAEASGGRKDYKIYCFAAELVKEFGDWNIFWPG